MPQSSAHQFSGIFVRYRRDDSAGHAGRLSDKLSEHFGKDQIFMDIDNIQPGEDFVQVIENAVGSCEILIAVIGRNWLSGTGRNTGPLDNPNDFVRLEIATALNRDIRVIPVLVQRATMPKPQDLPDDLSKLSRRNAMELSDLRWRYDVDQLVAALERILAQRKAAARLAEVERQAEAEERDKKNAEQGSRLRTEEQRVHAKPGAEKRPRADEGSERRRVEDEQEAERLCLEEGKQGSWKKRLERWVDSG